MKATARRSTRIWGLDQYGVSFGQLPYLVAIHHNLSLSLLGTLAHAQSVHSQGMPLHVPQSTAH